MIGISAVVEKFKHMLRLLSKGGIITADSAKTMKLGIMDRVLTDGWMARRVAEVIVGVSVGFVMNVGGNMIRVDGESNIEKNH